MDLAAAAINDTEQAAEKVSDHLFSQLLSLVATIFTEIRKTRMTIEFSEKE